MLKFLLLAVIATVQCLEVKDKLNRDPVVKYALPAQQGHVVDGGFIPRTDWSYFHPSWSLPAMPKMSFFFKDDEDDYSEEQPTILKRLATVEKMINELNDLLKKQAIGLKKIENSAASKKKPEEFPCQQDSRRTTMDKVPEKDVEKPQSTDDNKPKITDKPVEPEKKPQTSEMIDKPMEDVQKPETVKKPDQPTATTQAPPVMDKVPEKVVEKPKSTDENKPEITDKPAEPEKKPQTSEMVEETMKDVQKPETVKKPDQPTETTQALPTSVESSTPPVG